MERLHEHIQNISEAISAWLKPDNIELKQAIDRTVREGLFSLEDIKHQIRHLKQSLQKEHLLEWASRSGLKYNSLKDRQVICLHAGNLPLVGIQDFLAVLLTGGTYKGKVSRKDPYLLPSLFSVCRNHQVLGPSLWSTSLDDLKDSNADFVLFAGSESSAPKVEEELIRLRVIKPDAPKLMRTSHFSIAYITDIKPSTMTDLTEAIFRYGGAGCRSVGVVVAPYHLDSEKCSFTDYVEAFWLKSPQHEKPTPALYHRYALNKGLEIPQMWLDYFLIEEHIVYPTEKFILHWVKGEKDKLEEIVNEFGKGLQSIYSTEDNILEETGNFSFEPISEAQTPPIWWKPDGKDSISWLQENNR